MPSPSLPPSAFAVWVEFTGPRVVLRLHGELDRLAAPQLDAMLGAVTSCDDRDLVLVLADVALIDADGLAVLSATARRLERDGRILALAASSSAVRRSLTLAGLQDHIRSEAFEAHPSYLEGQEMLAAVGSRETPAHQLLDQLWKITAIPAYDDVVDAALRLVVALASTTVDGADGASVSLRRHGRLTTAAWSDRTVLQMDADQYATGEGPCVDAASQGRRFHLKSLDAETRWPAFRPRAEELGITAILSSPLLVRERPVGALNLYSRSAGAFHPQDVELAMVLATEASVILADAGVDVMAGQIPARVAGALLVRQIIAQAQGVLMATEGLDDDAAYAVLRRRSAENGRPLAEHASAVVSAAIAGPVAPSAASMEDVHDD